MLLIDYNDYENIANSLNIYDEKMNLIKTIYSSIEKNNNFYNYS